MEPFIPCSPRRVRPELRGKARKIAWRVNPGNRSELPEEATIEGFRARQGCSTTVEPRSPAPCQRFVGCEAGGEVASCRIPGLGHQIWRDGRRDLYDYLLSI